MTYRALITDLARGLGFDQVHFSQLMAQAPGADRHQAWVQAGLHAGLPWLERGEEVRASPRLRLPSARTAVVLGVHHAVSVPRDPGGWTGRVARYAWGRDYHNFVGKRLRKLRKRLAERGVQSWGGVDTAPILERGWATAAGMGFSGKNGMQILPGRGSYWMLAVLFVDVEVTPDAPVGQHCGRCVRCLGACPTDAIVAPGWVDTARCVSYWTIEARGLPPRSLRPRLGRWLFGCDDCQQVCPHNQTAREQAHADFRARHAWLDLAELLTTPDEVLMERFLGTPLRRPGAAGLKRNALLVLANLGDAAAVALVQSCLGHPAPVVRAAAVWALWRLGETPRHHDSDPLVCAELRGGRPG